MANCKNPKCGGKLDGTERFCRLCGFPVSGGYSTEAVTIHGCKTAATADGKLFVSVSDYLGSYIDVRVSVFGHPERAVKSMGGGEVVRYDAGADGVYEVKLLAASFLGDGSAEFLVARKV